MRSVGAKTTYAGLHIPVIEGILDPAKAGDAIVRVPGKPAMTVREYDAQAVPRLLKFSVVITPHELTRCLRDDPVPVEELRAFVLAIIRSNTEGPVPSVNVERVQ
jgi:hypothetical protein